MINISLNQIISVFVKLFYDDINLQKLLDIVNFLE